MKKTIFLSVSIDGFIADKAGIPSFPEGAWEDWCSLVNETNSLVAGRTSQKQVEEFGADAALTAEHKIVISSQDLDLSESTWQGAKSPAEALEILESKGVDEVIIGGGRTIANAFIREGLVDFIIIDLQPVAFGNGTQVFGDFLGRLDLKLLETSKLNENAIRLKYQVV
jgi:dihydrofolate reductase